MWRFARLATKKADLWEIELLDVRLPRLTGADFARLRDKWRPDGMKLSTIQATTGCPVEPVHDRPKGMADDRIAQSGRRRCPPA